MSSFKASNILIFGGTGQIGRYITSALLRASPSFSSVTLFTSEATASSPDKTAQLDNWRARGLRITTGDIKSSSDVAAAYKGVDTVVSAVGRNVLEHQIDLLRLAEESGSVRWFLPSEYGTDVEYGPKSAGEKPHQLKLKVRALVKREITKVHVSYIVTGPYFDMWVDPIRGIEQAGGINASERKAAVINEGNGKIGFCTMLDVGKAVVAALRHPDSAFDKALKVQSFVVTPNEVIAEYEKQTGEKFAVSHLSLDELRELEGKLWAEGHEKATGVTLRRIWSEGYTLYDKTDNESIGLKESDLETMPEAVRKLLSSKPDEL